MVRDRSASIVIFNSDMEVNIDTDNGFMGLIKDY